MTKVTEPALNKNRAAILEVLQRSPQPMSAYAILDALRERGVKSPPIVYRALKYLEENGHIHRIDSKNAYIACHGGHTPHEASVLLVCDDCGKVEEADEPALLRKLSEAARAHHFRATHHTIELRGHCGHCG